MAFLATDKDGSEWIFNNNPYRDLMRGIWRRTVRNDNSSYIQLPAGSIRKLIGRELTWEDEPVELKGE